MKKLKKNIDLIFVDDKTIRTINKRHLNKDNVTDVIAFDYGNSDPSGEVYISVGTAKRQAKQRKVSVGDELLRLSVHGLVHLEGHDDESLKEFCVMRMREWEILIKAL